MRYSTVMSHLAKVYEIAKDNKMIRKPLSYSLYKTWEWCDRYEKERDTKKDELHRII